MTTTIQQIEIEIQLFHKSVWGFCSAIEDTATYEGSTELSSRATSMLVQGLREWSSYRQSARKEYESLIKQSQDCISNIDSNHSIYFDVDSDRVKEYNAKAATQVEIVRTASYIIGLSNETLAKLFAVVTTLQFAK